MYEQVKRAGGYSDLRGEKVWREEGSHVTDMKHAEVQCLKPYPAGCVAVLLRCVT